MRKKACNIKARTYDSALGYVILPKVLKNIGIVNFPITLALRTSPSEKFSKKIFIYYPAKQVEVLLYDLLNSDFGPITWTKIAISKS